MRWIVGAAVTLPTLLLALGAVTGRVRARSCCAIADPRCDTRMRGAFTTDHAAAGTPVSLSAPAAAPAPTPGPAHGRRRRAA